MLCTQTVLSICGGAKIFKCMSNNDFVLYTCSLKPGRRVTSLVSPTNSRNIIYMHSINHLLKLVTPGPFPQDNPFTLSNISLFEKLVC